MMKLDTLLEAIKVAIEHIADKITVNGVIFSASFGFALYGFWGYSKISLCIGCATCVFLLSTLYLLIERVLLIGM